MKIRKTAFLFAAALTAAAVAGCSGSRETAATTAAEASAEETTAVEEESPETAKDTEDAENTENAGDGDEENYETGDASLDNPRNQDDIGENELLVAVSYTHLDVYKRQEKDVSDPRLIETVWGAGYRFKLR